MLDLDHATRDALIALVLDQRDALADRDRRIAGLETEVVQHGAMIAQLATQVGDLRTASVRDDDPRGTPKGMPGLKATEPPVRTPRRAGSGRRGLAGAGCRRPRGWSTPWRPVRRAGRHWPGARANGRGK